MTSSTTANSSVSAMSGRTRGATSAPDNARKWRDALKERGYKKVEIWVPEDMVPKAKALEQALRARAVLSYSPLNSNITTERLLMSDLIETPWTVTALLQALLNASVSERAEFDVELVSGADPILQVTMIDYGALPIYVSVNGEQILASTLLWPVADQPDAAKFNEFLLRTHKVLPLSTFGITTIDGRDYYELFGALSARAGLADVVTELRMLATNAIEVAELRTAA